jgi:hypothetical protein
MAESDAAIATDAARFQPPRPYRSNVDRTLEPPSIGTSASVGASINPDPATQYPRFVVPQPKLEAIPESNEDHNEHPVLDGTPSPSAPSTAGGHIPVGLADRPVLLSPGPHSAVLAPTGMIGRTTQLPPVERPTASPTRSAPPPAARPASGPVTSIPSMVPPPMSRPSNMPGGALAPSGRAASAYGRRRQRDSDDPWAIKEAVPAVIEPQPAPSEHDPGPGVIGIDR